MDLEAREQLDRQRFVRGRRGFYALCAATIALAFAVTPRTDAIVASAMAIALVVAATVATRGAEAAPVDARESLRARARARLRLAWVIRVAVVVFAVVNLVRSADPVTIGTSGGAIVFVWALSYWMERRIRGGLSRL